jgi:thymidylate synthase (FAD)
MNKGYEIKTACSHYGYVRYIDHLGTDERIVEAARISYKSPSKGEEADKKLLEYLFKNRHTSPLEQCNITFNIKMPIFVMRQFVRHRTFRLNEWSGRYSEMVEEMYTPILWRTQDKTNKQGSVPVADMIDWHTGNTAILKNSYDVAYTAYQRLIDHGVAKELARIVLPLGLYTEIYVNCDLHNLIHFFNLRISPHAQQEIRDVAYAMLSITEKLFPWTIALYDKYKPEMVKVETIDKIR